jgi:small GTP-binding protein
MIIMSREIVLIGRSNVGKSTLFWELTGKKVRVGKRPGITQYPFRAKVGDIYYVDMPGYGFMLKASRAYQEKTKDLIVHYFEQKAEEILLAIQVIDAASFLDIADRWEGRGEVPFEVELWEFLTDMGLDVVLAANKMDRIAKVDVDGALDLIGERLGMMPPWTQWTDRIAPISAKRGQIQLLRDIIGKKISG